MNTANRNAGASEINPKGNIYLVCLLLKEPVEILTQYFWLSLGNIFINKLHKYAGIKFEQSWTLSDNLKYCTLCQFTPLMFLQTDVCWD